MNYLKNLFFRDFKDTENIETVKDTKNVENEKSSIEQVPAASLESTSTSTVDAIPVPKDAK